MPQDSNETRNVISIGVSDAVPPNQTAPSNPASNNDICDSEFITELNRLRNLKGFLNNEAVVLAMSDADSKALGELFTLRANSKGRSPTGQEWTEVDKFNQLFFQRLTESQRRRFLLGGIPDRFARLPITFAGIALLSLLAAVTTQFLASLFYAPESPLPGFLFFEFCLLPCYLFWLISLGAIGSIAFIGMNALSVQQDITFDLLNPRLINLRVALGALFALVLALPFGYPGFQTFIKAITDVKSPTLSSFDALMMIIPFLLGFSTSLVIMVLNRMLEATQSFFGKTLITTTPAATLPPTSSTTFGPGDRRSVRKRQAGAPNPGSSAGPQPTSP